VYYVVVVVVVAAEGLQNGPGMKLNVALLSFSQK
jgi:hypothetical protein